MSLAESLTIAVLVLTGIGVGIGMPVFGVMLKRQDAHRDGRFDRLEDRLIHFDECMDDLKNKVIGTAATRAELESRLAQLRAEIHADTDGLHGRIMRLEDQALRHSGALK